MKKKVFLAAFMTCMVSAAVLFGTTVNKTESKKIVDMNVEALANEENSGANCSGYRDWAINGENEGASKREFYDCTCTLRSGYDPSGNCQ